MTLKIKNCPSCRGSKAIWGMGFMAMEKCKTCDGIGHVPDIEDAEIDAILQTKPAQYLLPIVDQVNDAAILERLTEPKPSVRKRSDRRNKAKA